MGPNGWSVSVMRRWAERREPRTLEGRREREREKKGKRIEEIHAKACKNDIYISCIMHSIHTYMYVHANTYIYMHHKKD